MTTRDLNYPSVLEIRHGAYALTISYDESPESPREWSSFGTFYLWQRGYVSPDKCEYGSFERFINEWAGLECVNCGYLSGDHAVWRTGCAGYTPDKAAPGADPDAVLFLVSHDDGYLRHRFTVADLLADSDDLERYDGVLFATGEQVRAEWAGDTAAAISCLLGELETYSAWANGEVFTAGWSRFDTCGACSHESETYLESVSGFYRPFDPADYAPEMPGAELVAILAEFYEWSGN
jgi:hypothetical protein